MSETEGKTTSAGSHTTQQGQTTSSGLSTTQPVKTIPTGPYIIQQGDTLYTIAKQVYGDDALWQQIYIANAMVIGANPQALTPGKTIFLLPHPQQSRTYQVTQYCVVNVPSLYVRASPTEESAWVANFPEGTTLNFHEVVEGEMIDGNPYWGHSIQNHYYWMGGTDRPNG